MKTITQTSLVELLSGIDHATPVGFVALTRADLKTTGNPYGNNVMKLTRVNAFAGTRAEASVNRQLAREGKEQTFVAQEARANQVERVSACLARKMVDGKPRYYLPVQVNHAREPLYLAPQMRGKRSLLTVVSSETLKPFMPPARKPVHQGTDKPVVFRDYALDSITQISILGEQLRVRA